MSYQKANKDELYTLSSEGVNQYRNNIHTEFTPLDQWQREVSFFTSLKQLKTFQIFKLWKGFRQAQISAMGYFASDCLTFVLAVDVCKPCCANTINLRDLQVQ